MVMILDLVKLADGKARMKMSYDVVFNVVLLKIDKILITIINVIG